MIVDFDQKESNNNLLALFQNFHGCDNLVKKNLKLYDAAFLECHISRFQSSSKVKIEMKSFCAN